MERTAVIGALALCLALAACDGDGDPDAGVDAGLFTPFDAGPRAFVDAAIDAGPPAVFTVRLAHQIPGMTGTEESPGAAHVCVWLFNDARQVPLPPQFLTQSTGPIPFRGVSPYLQLAVVSPLDYVMALYEPSDVATGCPSDPYASDAPEAALLDRLPADATPVDSVSTALAIGFARGTLGADEGALPARCDPTPNPAPFDEPCPEAFAARLIVVADDLTPPADGMARLRVSNQIQNIAPVGFNVCYEASLAPDVSMPPGACLDTNPSDTPSLLFANVTPGTVTEYVERAPITPTVPSMGFGGAIYLVPETTGATGCPPFAALPAGSRCLPILAAFPTAPPAANIQPQLVDGAIGTLFISGVLGLSGEDAAAFGSLMFIWQDN